MKFWLRLSLVSAMVLASFGLVGVSAWRARVDWTAQETPPSEALGMSVLGEQSMAIDAWPGTPNYAWERLGDWWRLQQAKSDEDQIRLRQDYVERRIDLAQTLLVHSKTTEAVRVLYRAWGYWVKGVDQTKTSNDLKRQFDSRWIELADRMELELRWALTSTTSSSQTQLEQLLDQVLAAKREYELLLGQHRD